jgi:anti-anti-sigma factor
MGVIGWMVLGRADTSPTRAPCYLSHVHRVAIERKGRTTVILAAGELDAFAAHDLASAFEDISGDLRVVADLDRVSFMDSTVLGLIVRASRELAEAGARVRIVLPTGSARRIFEITALDAVLPVAETRSAALAELEA